MSRRADPVRIYEAHRAGNLNRLIGEGEFPDRAVALIAAWEAEAERLGLSRDTFWDGAWDWIATQRRPTAPRSD